MISLSVHGGAHVGGRQQLTGDRPQVLDALLERSHRAAQTLEAHGADDVGRVEQRLAVGHGEAGDGRHELRAVQQREAFFGLERDRRDAGGVEHRTGRHAFAPAP